MISVRIMISHQNDVTVKEELAQLSDLFKLIEDINQEMIQLDDNYTEELQFTDTDEKVFSFKHKVHNWLRQEDEMQRKEKKNQDHHVPDLQAPSHHLGH